MDKKMTDKETYEKLSAFLDGEVPTNTAEQIKQDLANKEELQRLLHQMKQVDTGVKSAFGDLLAEPVQLKNAAAIADAFASHKKGKQNWQHSQWFSAVAASILTVIVSSAIGFVAFERYNERVIDQIAANQEASQLMLANILQETLEKQVSGTATEYADATKRIAYKVVPLNTYKSNSGHWCREFSERVEKGGVVEIRTGLACREKQGQWHRLSTTVEGKLGRKL